MTPLAPMVAPPLLEESLGLEESGYLGSYYWL